MNSELPNYQLNETQEKTDDDQINSISPPSDASLNLKNLQNQKNNHETIPILDSYSIFQPSSITNSNSDHSSILSLNNTISSQLPLISFINDSDFLNDNGSIEKFDIEQSTTKNSIFSAAEINVDQYFQDLYSIELGIRNLRTKEDFLSAVSPYCFTNFAVKHFRKQRTFIFTTPIDQLTTFSDKPLSKPLLEKVPLEKKSIVNALSTQILTYIGSIKDKYVYAMMQKNPSLVKDNSLISIINILHEDDSLVDECLVLIIRTMQRPPNEESLISSWNLFLSISYLFYVRDDDTKILIMWLLVNAQYEEGKVEKIAKYTFLRFYERNLLQKDFKNMNKNDIVHIPLGVTTGKTMFKCSLYIQMWNQQRRFPKLPVPLALYLIVKNLIKNGVLMTPNPFPKVGGRVPIKKKKTKNEDEPKKPIEDADNNVNDNVSIFVIENNNEDAIINEDEQKEDANENNKSSNENNENDDENNENDNENNENDNENNENDNENNENGNENNENDNENNENDNKNNKSDNENNENDNENNENGNKYNENGNKYNENSENDNRNNEKLNSEDEDEASIKYNRKPNMSRVKQWVSKLSSNNDIIEDGEVCDLFGLLITWMVNLLDPIVPKCMSEQFIDTFSSDYDEGNFGKYKEFVDNLPLLHRSTLMYLVGFLREIAKNEKLTKENNQTIAESLSGNFVQSSFTTIDPFTRQKMSDIAPRFLLYCLENLDVSVVYPLNPEYLECE